MKKFKKQPEQQQSNISLKGYDDFKLSPLQVEVYDGNFEKAFKIFKAIVQKERILSIYKEKQHYEKPSDKKRRKRNESRKRLMELDTKVESDKESNVRRGN